MIALVLALTLTTLTPRTVVDTVQSEITKEWEVAFMNAHADLLKGKTPTGFIVNGSDTSVIVKSPVGDTTIYTQKGWETFKPTAEAVDTISVNPVLRIIRDTMWWGQSWTDPCGADTIAIYNQDAIVTDSSRVTIQY